MGFELCRCCPTVDFLYDQRLLPLYDERFAPLEASISFVLSEATDPWEGIHSEVSAIAKERASHFLVEISTYYGIPRAHFCIVLGKATHCDIIFAHLWPQLTAGRGMETFGLNSEDLTNPRNFLRLHNTIEKAFDRKRLAFLPADDFVSGVGNPVSLKVVILDPKLHQEPLSYGNTSTTMGALHNKAFHFKFPPEKSPFLRVIAIHAFRAHQNHPTISYPSPSAYMYDGQRRVKELARKSLDKDDPSFVMQRFFGEK